VKLFCYRAAADHFAALENQRLEAALREIERGNKRVVTAANKEYTLSKGHGQFFSLTEVAGDEAVGSTGVSAEA
jgi:hypothetical protein